ncbi:MAG: ABC transporter substrate-binding protein [Oscillospiraceae bacterium]|nr:ABC transporter substrate-binding protein [Oscillospiraceae bacterium]
MKKIIAMLLAAVMLFALCACGQKAAEAPAPAPAETPAETQTEPAATAEPEPPAETVITDMIGREVTIVPGNYKRIVCIGAGALRMFCYIGDPNLLCGVEDIDNTTAAERPKMFDSVARPYVLAYGDIFNTLPSCGVGGPNAQTAEAEKILACEPDLVISEYEDVEKEDALQEQLGVPVITLKGSQNVFSEEFSGTMALLGKVLAKEQRAQELVDYVAAQGAEIAARVADIPDEEKPLVYICGLGNWGTTNHLMTSAKFPVFMKAGIKNVLADMDTPGVFAIEEEKFVDIGADMDIMIIDAAAVKNIKPLYAEDSTMFDSSKAWQNGKVYLQMAYNAYYTNLETVLMNTWYAASIVYPEQFADLDMTAKTNEITEMFLGKPLADQIFACPSSFGGYQQIDTANFFS